MQGSLSDTSKRIDLLVANASSERADSISITVSTYFGDARTTRRIPQQTWAAGDGR